MWPEGNRISEVIIIILITIKTNIQDIGEKRETQTLKPLLAWLAFLCICTSHYIVLTINLFRIFGPFGHKSRLHWHKCSNLCTVSAHIFYAYMCTHSHVCVSVCLNLGNYVRDCACVCVCVNEVDCVHVHSGISTDLTLSTRFFAVDLW